MLESLTLIAFVAFTITAYNLINKQAKVPVKVKANRTRR
jgi:hypothetical protein